MHQSSARKIVLFVVALIISIHFAAHGQKSKRDKCAIHLKDFAEATRDYQRYHKCLGVKSGEMVASVGAGTGRIELLISMFVDSVHWTLQDVDTTCLAKTQLNKAIAFHEKLSGRKISDDFAVVLGTIDKTNLQENNFNRVIMVDVYHELSSPQLIIEDIRRTLTPGGQLVILERMGKKKGEMHGCNFPKLLEAEFIRDMKKYGFKLENKVVPNDKLDITYFTFVMSES